MGGQIFNSVMLQGAENVSYIKQQLSAAKEGIGLLIQGCKGQLLTVCTETHNSRGSMKHNAIHDNHDQDSPQDLGILHDQMQPRI